MTVSLIIKSLLLIVSLFSYSSCQYIATSYGYENVLVYILEDIQTALGDPLLKTLQSLQFKDFAKDNVAISGIKPTLTSPNVDDSYGDIKSNFYIISPDKLSVLFDFSYKINQDPEKKAELELNIFDLRLELKTNEDKTEPKINVQIEVRKGGFDIYSDGDKQKLQDVFFSSYAEQLDALLKEGLTKTIETYFKTKTNKAKAFTFQLPAFLGKQQVSVNLNKFVGFNEVKSINYDSATSFYSGNVLDTVDTKLRDEAFAYEKFIKPSVNKKLFLNYKILTDAISQLIQDKEIVIYLSNTSPIAQKVPFKFTILDLKKVILDTVLASFKDEDPFSVTTSITGMTFSEDTKQINLLNCIIIMKQAVVSFKTKINFEVNYVKGKYTDFNLCISEIKSIDIEMVTPNAIKDLQLLKDWTLNTLKLFVPNDMCLANNSINLRDYFKGEIKNFIAGKNGFYLEAASLY